MDILQNALIRLADSQTSGVDDFNCMLDGALVAGASYNGTCMSGVCVDGGFYDNATQTYINGTLVDPGFWDSGMCIPSPTYLSPAEFNPIYYTYVFVLATNVVVSIVALGNIYLAVKLANFKNLKIFDVLGIAGCFFYMMTDFLYFPMALSGWAMTDFYWGTAQGYYINLCSTFSSLLAHRLTLVCFTYMSIYRFTMIRSIANYPKIINTLLIWVTAAIFGANILGVHIWNWYCNFAYDYKAAYNGEVVPNGCMDQSTYVDNQYGTVLVFYYLMLDILLGIYFIIVVLKTKRLWSRARTNATQDVLGYGGDQRSAEEVLFTQIVRYFYLWIAVTWICLICWSLSLGVTGDGFYGAKIAIFFSNIGFIFEGFQFTFSIAFLAKMRGLATLASAEMSKNSSTVDEDAKYPKGFKGTTNAGAGGAGYTSSATQGSAVYSENTVSGNTDASKSGYTDASKSGQTDASRFTDASQSGYSSGMTNSSAQPNSGYSGYSANTNSGYSANVKSGYTDASQSSAYSADRKSVV